MVHKRLLKTWALAFALPVLLLSSCSNDELEGTEPGGATGNGGDIRFEIGFVPQGGAAYADGPQTKAATDNLFYTTWENGDEIGIFAVTSGQSLSATASGNHIHNVKLTYNKSTNKWTPATPLYWPGGGKLDFYAYHPYDASVTDPTAITFNVRVDQSGITNSKSNYNLSDLLTAKASKTGGYGKGETVPLTFSHALAMVQVTLTADRQNNIGPVGDISVSLRGAKTASTLNLSGQAVTATGDAQNVTMYRAGETADGEPIFRALVPAQTVQDSYTFLLGQFNELYRSVGGSLLTAGQAQKHGVKMPFMPTVEIKKGTFQMGSPDSEPNRYSGETQHQVTLTQDFYMSRYQVTNAQYAAFLNAINVGNDGKFSASDYASGQYPDTELVHDRSGISPWGVKWESDKWVSFSGYENHPVIYVTWYGAAEYARWVGGSLPTEAQWEYACRGNSTNKAAEAATLPFGIGTGRKLVSGMANYYIRYSYDLDYTQPGHYDIGNNTGYLGKTSPVGNYSSNNYGLYDMHGNVWEWCLDQWDGSDNYLSLPSSDPVGTSGNYRVLRGGSWISNAQFCRSAYRYFSSPDYAYDDYGFRVVFVSSSYP